MKILRKKHTLFILLTASFFAASCSMTRSIPEGQSLLKANKIEFTTGRAPEGVSDLSKYLKQSPQSGVMGWNPFVSLYSTGDGSGKGWDKFAKLMGRAPVIFDPSLVESSKTNMLNHLQYKGYYNSIITDSIYTHNKKTTVTYMVTPGKRYYIDSISLSMTDLALYDIYLANRAKSLIGLGTVVSEDILEKESERMASIYRNNGYFGFTKNYFFFTADTLRHNGAASLDIAVKDYTRNETPEEARPHNVYFFGDVIVTTIRSFPENERAMRMEYDSASIARRDSMLRVFRSQIDTVKYRDIYVVQRGQSGFVRKKLLNRLNLIKTDKLYSEADVENTYTRFSSLGLFSTVNIQLNELDSLTVQPSITLQATNLQGYKLNLQGSTNSNGLLGISPSISYFHKNLFKGAELLTVGLMGDFQFKLHDNVRSTELGASVSLDIPKFFLAPERWFRSRVIPHTVFSMSYNYQKRPEYTRNIISGSYSYTWSIGKRWYLKASPLQANIVKLYNLDSTFYANLNDPFLRNSYRDHFDLGVGASIYYTTDNSVNPAGSYFYFRYSLDLSGNVVSLFNHALPTNKYGEKTLWGSPYSQYYKMEGSAVYTFKFGNNPSHMLALRGLAGVGKGYGNSSGLPFEKLFWGGGAYDMRGWQPRTLGPGYAPRDTAFTIANQTGDIKLEANAEYRFPMFWLLRGAVFTDVGNIWTFKKSAIDQTTGARRDERGVFRADNFYKHLAWDWGAGLRLDLTFALIRLDLGFKTYDPAKSQWNGPGRWFKQGNFEFSFGIGYPF